MADHKLTWLTQEARFRAIAHGAFGVRMLNLAFRRLLFAIPTLFAIIAVTFALMHAAPGGPFDKERRAPPEIERRLQAEYGLDLPVHEQLLRYVGGLLQGDLGPSMAYKDKTVADIIAEGAPTSLILGFSAMVLALLMGTSLGVLAALRQNKAQDYGVMALAVMGVCLPPLVVGPILQLMLGVQLQWMPTAGLYRDEFGLRYLVLPILTLSLPLIAIISRLTRASMIETLRSNAIRTARAKGLPEINVVLRHALPVALLPVVSYAGPALAGVMAGSFVVESVFQLPGIGRQFVIAAQQRDYTLVMGVVLVYSLLIITLNLAADLLYRALDPRSRS
jgi:oligopeptide transport system permease protein